MATVRPSRNPSAGTLVDLAVQLHRDEAMSEPELWQRDQAIGRQLAEERPSDRADLLARWLAHLPDSPRRGESSLTVAGLLAIVIGLLAGYAAAMGVFYYDGSQPVNIVRVLGVFVVLQGLLLVLFVVASLPMRGGLPEALRELSPGWLSMVARRWVPQETRRALEQVVSRGEKHQIVYSRVQKWQVLTWSQAMAVAFNLAAIAGALQLIVTSDLAFSWSTTLDVEPHAMHRFTTALSLPWCWWSDAVPSLELVTQTQTYRAEAFGDALDATQALWFTRWWKFLFAALVCYGLIPRLITFSVCKHRLNIAARRAMEFTPGVEQVVARLTPPTIETRSDQSPPAATRETESASSLSASAPAEPAGVVLAWSGVDAADGSIPVGGGRSLEQDRAAAAQAADATGPVRIRVKAWEPPVLEFVDFVGDLRAAIGSGRTIQVQPVGGDALDQRSWIKRLAAVSDPWLAVVDDTPDSTPATAGTPPEGQP